MAGVARDAAALASVREQIGDGFTPVAADAADPVMAGALLVPVPAADVLVLAAGAAPLSRPIHHHTWETFSANWETDVRQVFGWTREALLLPLEPGSTVIAFSSGAVLAARRCPAVTPGPRRRSSTSPATPRTRPSGRAWACGSARCCRS